MISASEIGALNAALASYEAYAARLRAVADDASFFSILGTSGRMDQIADDAAANIPRFYARRDELVTMDPADHEAILAYCEAIAHATGSELAAAMAAEVATTDPVRFVRTVAADTVTDVKTAVTFGVPVILIGALAFFLLTRKG